MDAPVATAADPTPRCDHKSRLRQWLALAAIALLGLVGAPLATGLSGGPGPIATDHPTAAPDCDAAWSKSPLVGDPAAEGAIEGEEEQEEEEDDRQGGNSALLASGRFAGATAPRTSNPEQRRDDPRDHGLRADRTRAPPGLRG